MEKWKATSKIRFLSSRFTLMIKTLLLPVLIWATQVLHLTPPMKKFCFCHYSLSKLQMFTNHPKSILLKTKMVLNSNPRLLMLPLLRFLIWISCSQDKSMSRLLFGSPMTLLRTTRINMKRSNNSERPSRIPSHSLSAPTHKTWFIKSMKVSEFALLFLMTSVMN